MKDWQCCKIKHVTYIIRDNWNKNKPINETYKKYKLKTVYYSQL